MSVAAILDRLSCDGVRVQAEGDRLRCVGSRRVLTPSVVEELECHKQEILRLLAEPRSAGPRSVEPETLQSVAEVVEIARPLLNPMGIEYDPPPVPPAPKGRDPLAYPHTQKSRFFGKGEGWRDVHPRGFEVHRKGGRA